ncbi:tyrosine-type recombinase/integrase [Bacillus sporothermodurans]|nr:tyrosine-type recombinase/integrase [Heyndrickxia sporothermodurans]MBL5866727.1 tyrosine-type recombinase/integrase [Heyndrickxia sporothermodurans]
MMLNNVLEQKKSFKSFPLQDFYKQDIWDLTKHPQFVELNENQKSFIVNRKHIIDFTNMKKDVLSNEIKYYCQYYIENMKRLITSFVTDVGGINLTIQFMNEQLNEIDSFIELELEKSTQFFSQFLISNGYKTHTETNNALSEDMEYKTYKTPTTYLRFFQNLHKFIHEQYNESNQPKTFFDKDKWDIRELPFKIQGFDPSRPRYILSFEKIVQENIKSIAKKYTLERLKTKKYSTCVDDLKGINYLSEFLHENYPEIQSLTQLNRAIIEEFLGFVNLNSNLQPRTQSSRIGSVKTFFETCNLFGWDEAPKQTLLLTDDVKKKYKVLPKFYEDDILSQINKNLEHLPVQIARMVFVLQNVGMRISELCTLKIDCIKYDTEDDPVLEYIQEKTKEPNRVPIKKDIEMAINEAIKYSREQFGENIKYVFMQDADRPISKDTFSYHMNQLIKKHDVRDSNGNLVRIKSHHFRGTVATKYANMGMSTNVIRSLLGQKSLGAIRHYVEILEETMTDAMQDLLNYQDQMIQNIGKKEAVIQINDEDKAELPLPNGRCAKPLSSGKCTHANACYTCAMFKPDPKNIDLFKYQLSEAQSNVEMAKINGFERVLQVNEDLVDALEKIIASIERRGA